MPPTPPETEPMQTTLGARSAHIQPTLSAPGVDAAARPHTQHQQPTTSASHVALWGHTNSMALLLPASQVMQPPSAPARDARRSHPWYSCDGAAGHALVEGADRAHRAALLSTWAPHLARCTCCVEAQRAYLPVLVAHLVERVTAGGAATKLVERLAAEACKWNTHTHHQPWVLLRPVTQHNALQFTLAAYTSCGQLLLLLL